MSRCQAPFDKRICSHQIMKMLFILFVGGQRLLSLELTYQVTIEVLFNLKNKIYRYYFRCRPVFERWWNVAVRLNIHASLS
jgi:hypothetical protein